MDSDQGKLFLGGISWETNEDRLKEYFSNYGEVVQAVVMRDKITGRPRGFGFIVFADPSILDRVLEDKHLIDGRQVDVKKALSREEQQVSGRSGNINPSRSSASGGNVRTKKIFVGGLPPTLTEEGFREYFEAYGHVTDVVIMYDQNTQRPRGFGFISFDTEEAVNHVLHKTFHDLDGKQVEIKRALPKDANPGGAGRSMSGSSGGGSGGYQGYGSSGGSGSAYDGRMDSNRYMQPQNTGSGFPAYGSGYGSAGYGYGPGSNGVGYGGYGGYAGNAGANYGNPNVQSAGYGSGPPGAPRSSWGGTQAPSGYGNMGHGNTVAGGGGLGPSVTSQSPGGATGYGNQAYSYGGYGGSDGPYGNSAGYSTGGARSGNALTGNVGAPGELQGSGEGYMGGGYSDTNGNAGYGNASWRSDVAQASGNYGSHANGGQVGYGGGYGGGQVRQAHQ